MARDTLIEAAKATPPALLVAWNKFSSIPAQSWLTYLTIGYVVLQAYVLFRDKIIRDRGGK